MAAREEIAKSRAYVESLDRTLLGRFAIPTEMLVYAEVSERALIEGIYLDDDAIAPGEHTTATLLDEMFENSGIDKADAMAEVHFWWARTHPKRFAKVGDFSFRWRGAEQRGRREKLVTIYAHPELHDYFAVGIWDVQKASELLSNGVDAELAVRL